MTPALPKGATCKGMHATYRSRGQAAARGTETPPLSAPSAQAPPMPPDRRVQGLRPPKARGGFQGLMASSHEGKPRGKLSIVGDPKKDIPVHLLPVANVTCPSPGIPWHPWILQCSPRLRKLWDRYTSKPAKWSVSHKGIPSNHTKFTNKGPACHTPVEVTGL